MDVTSRATPSNNKVRVQESFTGTQLGCREDYRKSTKKQLNTKDFPIPDGKKMKK